MNGVYRIAGATVTVGDIVVEDEDWGSFDAATHITGSGLSGGAPVIAEPLKTTLLANGFTVVVVYMPTGTIGSATIEMCDTPDYIRQWIASVAYDEDEIGSTNSLVYAQGMNVPFSPFPDKDAAITFSATLAPDHSSASVNGGAVETATTVEEASSNNTVGITRSGASIRTMTFYPPQADAALPALSGLPAAPEGFAYLVDNDGAFVLSNDDEYILVEI